MPNSKERKIREHEEQINSIVNNWTKKGIDFDKQLSKTKEWLRNFDVDEISYMIKLIEYIELYGNNDANSFIKKWSNHVKSICDEKLERTRIISLDSSRNSSGSQYLYELSKKLGVATSDSIIFPSDLEILKKEIQNSKVDYVIVIDDFIGSGNQAITFYKEQKYKDYKDHVKVIYCTLFGLEKGVDTIRKSNTFDEVFVSETLSNGYVTFSDNSFSLKDEVERNLIKDIACKYGDKIYKKNPLGYDEGQLLFVLPHNVPNNTLPIIWANENCDVSNFGKAWAPLFPREKSFNNFNNSTNKSKQSISENRLIEEIHINSFSQMLDKDLYTDKLSKQEYQNTVSRLILSLLPDTSRKRLLKKDDPYSLYDSIVTMAKARNNDKLPVVIEGEYGSGKSLLLIALYFYVKCNKPKLTPVYIDLLDKNFNLLESELKKLHEKSEQYKLNLFVILDGLDEGLIIEDKKSIGIITKYLHGFSNLIVGRRAYKKHIVVKKTDSLTSNYFILQPIMCDNTERVEDFIKLIWEIYAENIDLAKFKEVVVRRIMNNSFSEIDVFIIKVLGTKMYGSKTNSLYKILQSYSTEKFSKQNTSIDTDDVSSALYSYLTSQNKSALRCIPINIVHNHYFVWCYYVGLYTYRLLIETKEKDFKNSNFRCQLWPNRINLFLKAVIESHNGKGQNSIKLYHAFNSIIKSLDNIDILSINQISLLINYVYALGRIKGIKESDRNRLLNELSNKAVVKSAFNEIINIQQPVFNDSFYTYENVSLTEDTEAHWYILFRSIRISRICLSTQKTTSKKYAISYIKECLNNRVLNAVNRGFHLVYYEDESYDISNTPPLDFLDTNPQKNIDLTFNVLIRQLANNDFNGASILQLFTLCSLVLYRLLYGSNDVTCKKKLVLAHLEKQNEDIGKIDSYEVKGFFKFCHLIFNSKTIPTEGSVYALMYNLKLQPRRGWMNKFKLNSREAENVAAHTWGAENIAFVFLPESISDDRNYSKYEVIKLIHFHDVGEAIIGDVARPDKSNIDKKNESLSQGVLNSYSVLNTFAGMGAVDLCDLSKQYGSVNKINAKYARDCDILDNVLQLLLDKEYLVQKFIQAKVGNNPTLLDKNDITIDAAKNEINDFLSDLRDDLVTDWGKEMYDRFYENKDSFLDLIIPAKKLCEI